MKPFLAKKGSPEKVSSHKKLRSELRDRMKEGGNCITETPVTIEDVITRRRNRALNRLEWGKLLVRIAIIATVFCLILSFFFTFRQAKGQDMFPAVKDGDLCVVFRRQLMKLLGERLAADDVISYTVNGERHLGRVVAVTGDTVKIDSRGTLTVNDVTKSGEILYPTYTRGNLVDITYVSSDSVFVLGDYRTQAEDSRDFGTIAFDDIDGKVITILRRRGL